MAAITARKLARTRGACRRNAGRQIERSVKMSDANELAARYIAARNERDGATDAALHFVGMDFVADGRLKSVTGFVDEMPARPSGQ
jgi:hypothetical protein